MIDHFMEWLKSQNNAISGLGRDRLVQKLFELESRITELQAAGTQLVISRQTMRENIAKHLTMRGRNDLATEVRALEFESPPIDYGILLPGKTCPKCGAFTSSMKSDKPCQGCGHGSACLKDMTCHCSDCRRERGMPP